ncbi:MAG: transcription-repair coupling factor [Deltaproteobacteria bacterium]|nr:MAG: transcription-repair coupling factor [Deltaproteobacteria bacterium]
MNERLSTKTLREEISRSLERERGAAWRLQGLHGGATDFVLGALAATWRRPALIIVDRPERAERLAEGIRTVLGEEFEAAFLARRVHVLPEREAPPLEMISPPAEVVAGRTAALYQAARGDRPIIVAAAVALAERTPAPEAVLPSCRYLVVGDELDRDAFAGELERLGYRRVGVVEEPGEAAVRGGIVDLWSPGSAHPYRIELFGDTIESLRTFDAGEQRSIESIEDVVVLPACPFALERLADAEVRRAVQARCNELLVAASERRRLDADMSAGLHFPGAELLLPYCAPVASLADYLPGDTVTIVVDPPAVEARLDAWARELDQAREAADQSGLFYPPVERLFLGAAELRAMLARTPLIEVDELETIEAAEQDRRRARIEVRGNEALRAARMQARRSRRADRLGPLAEQLNTLASEGRLAIVVADQTQRARVEHLLELCGLGPRRRARGLLELLEADSGAVFMTTGVLESGFRLPADAVAVVTDEDLFGRERRPVRRRRVSRARALTALAEASPGDYMVHVDHGIGRYHGLKHMVVGETEGDFIHLEYAGGDRYYLPIDRINLVEKYTGAGGTPPPLSRLGSAAWERTKKKAKESVLKLASELLDLEAYRAVHTRAPLASAGPDFEDFEAQFPFEETEGQKEAIAQVIADLSGEKPMDRVVCGDVGYGKTEVALRAAYLTVMGGRQVAFLVPTTVLARQHLDTIRARFADYPVEVAMLSRFNTRAENQAIVERLAAGTIDIVVGTHRLLQRDVRFARLGLLVVDEEHRFGVRHKERIKRMRREVDVLTMTATPIPRTLQLALAGVRDLSLIETPPVDRLAIRTYVARYDEALIKQAIERELARKGQVFFVHHRVASIGAVAHRVSELVPKARVAIAHGQMKEDELDHVMAEFLAGERDVLVCTSIIESGLDIPNANTIIVNRADTFGLAQLYQIRGRVGRSSRRAYAYLLVPNQERISEDARRRLAVLQELDDLGSGFRLAAHDMEIRGAGNLLGKEQSGHVAAVGFDLFMRMMEEASEELRGRPPAPVIEPEIDLGAEAFLPESYVDDVGERLMCYKRMASADSREALDAIVDELTDRFGPPPRPVRDLVRVMALRPGLKRLAVESLKAGGKAVALRFHESSPIEPEALVELARSGDGRYRLRPGGVLTMTLAGAGWDERVGEVEELIERLSTLIGERDRQGDGDERVHVG